MTKNRVLVIGANGMLGSHVAEELCRRQSVDVVLASRDRRVGGEVRDECIGFEYAPGSIRELVRRVGGVTQIVNCVAVPPSRQMRRASQAELFVANALLPLELAETIRDGVEQVVHVGSDGVFDGTQQRPYYETDRPDDRTDYGISKAIGEARVPGFLTLRTSIVGVAPWRCSKTLLDWLVTQPAGATVPGFINHCWNGVTALALARLISVFVEAQTTLEQSVLHVSSYPPVTKFRLLQIAAAALDREDVSVTPRDDEVVVNRTLGTCYPDLANRLWVAAGYAAPPTIDELLTEYGNVRGSLI